MTVPSREKPRFRNEAMRRLNHEHIFDVPLRAEGSLAERLDQITPGWTRPARRCAATEHFAKQWRTWGAATLSREGTALIHGDFFPGSLLRIGDGGLRVIDPEFSFCGDPEFDIGVFTRTF